MTCGDEREVGIPLILLEVQHGEQGDVHVRLNKESHCSVPEKELFELFGDFGDFRAKFAGRPHKEDV